MTISCGVIASQAILQQDQEGDGWVTVFEMTTSSGNSTGLESGRNFRQRINSDFPRAGIGQMRVTYAASASQGMNITSAAVGKASAANQYDYQAGTQVAITFDGGSAGFSIAAGETKVSDPVTFSFVETDNLVFALFTDASPENTGVAEYDLDTGTGSSTNNNSFLQTVGDINVDSTMTTDVTLGVLSIAGKVDGIKKIEVNP